MDRPRSRHTLVFVSAVAVLGVVLICCLSPAQAAAARDCGHRRVQTKIGLVKLYFRVRGPVRCRAAKKVVRSYFHQPTSECVGSGCFIHLASGWTCHAAPGEVTVHQGSVAACARNHDFERIATSRFPDRGFELIWDPTVVKPSVENGSMPRYRHCGSFQARYRIHVLARHVSCRKARRVQREYWLAPESEKELVGPDEYNGYVRLKRFPGWRCTSGARAGACVKGRKEASYFTS